MKLPISLQGASSLVSCVASGLAVGLIHCALSSASLEALARPDSAQDQAKKSLQALLISPEERPQIDGQLSDPAWSKVKWSAGFVERRPTPGDEPPVESSLGVLYDGEAIYVGVKMETREGEPPVAWELRRDRTSMWSDDAISIKLDPRSDQRTSLVFVTNAAGAQLDFIALDNGAVFSVEYDTIWEVKTSVSPREWIAEYRIPLSSLLISERSVELESIGINASRDHNARQATDDWSLLAPEFGPFSALHYGRLEGLKGLKSARLLTLTPYGVLKAGTSPIGTGLKSSSLGLGDESAAQLGGEFKLSLSHSEWVEGTVLTDFAQVDLDDPLINLNRFALYFPERRPFFINGLDIFSFGKRGVSQLFFSRRIGLSATGGELPITGGLKLYGRRGAVRYGALSVLTDDDQASDEPSQLFNVARARYDWGSGGSVGFMAVNRANPLDQDDALHYGMGVDGRARLFDTRLELTGFYGLTINQDALEDRMAGGDEERRGATAGVEVSWRDRNLRPSLSLEWVEGDFDPVMGFVYRSDYAQSSAGVSYSLFSPTESLRTIALSLEGDLKRSSDLSIDLGDSATFTSMLCSNSNWCLMGSAKYERDQLLSPFELSGVLIDARRYDSWLGLLALSSPQGRRFGGSLQYFKQQGYFGGQLHNLQSSVNVALSPQVRLASALNYAQFTVEGRQTNDAGEAIGPLLDKQDQSVGANLQLLVTPSPTVLIDAVTQVSSATSQLMSQARLRWRYLPGSDLFLVLRRAEAPPSFMERLSLGGDAPLDWRLTFKLSWRFDHAL